MAYGRVKSITVVTDLSWCEYSKTKGTNMGLKQVHTKTKTSKTYTPGDLPLATLTSYLFWLGTGRVQPGFVYYV